MLVICLHRINRYESNINDTKYTLKTVKKIENNIK